jgi:hypothetical protein
MYDSELVIRAGALSALKRLCLEAGVWSGVRASKSLNDEGYVHTMYHNMLCIFLFHSSNFLLVAFSCAMWYSVVAGLSSMIWCAARLICHYLLQKPRF